MATNLKVTNEFTAKFTIHLELIHYSLVLVDAFGMEYLRQIEEDLLSLGLEAKKKYPEIKDSTDRAVSALKIIRGLLES